MAAELYPAFLRALMKKRIDMEADALVGALLDDSYTYSAAHTHYANDISGAEISTVALANKNVLDLNDNAAFDADNITFSGVSNGVTVAGIVIYHSSSKIPILFRDDADSFPFVSDGSDVPISFSNANSRIFEL